MIETNITRKARSLFHRVMENSSLRGVVLIGSGTAAGLGLVMLATPIISRLYGPQAYGALAVFSGFLTIAGVLVTFRFEAAIPLPEKDEEARDLLFLTLTLSVLFAGVLSCCLIIWQFLTKEINPDPIYRHFAWTLPVGMIGIGFYQSLAYWATRKQLYKPISATRLNQSISSIGTQVLLHRLPPQGLGLILAYIVGQAFGVRHLWYTFRNSSPKAPLPSIAKLGLVARKYFKLSAYGSATALALAFGSGLPSLLLAKAYSLEVAGLYLMAWRVFGLPAQMVGSAVSQVFIGEASRRFREDPQSVPGYFHSVHRNLIWVGVGVLCIGVISPSVMPWILGPKWNSAGTVIMILAPMAAMDITVTPMYNITVIGNRPKLQLFTGILPLGLSIAGLGIPILMGFSYKISIFCYSLCRCLGSGLIFITYRNIARTIGIRKIEPVNPSESNFNIDG